MFGLKQNTDDPFDKLVAEATAAIVERDNLTCRIEKENADLAKAEANLAAAQDRVRKEEYEAAQAEGGLAVASKAAQQAVADAELKLKSIRFRLQGLEEAKGRQEQAVREMWEGLEAHREQFWNDQIERLGREYSSVIDTVASLGMRAFALRRHSSKGRPSKLNVQRVIESRLLNPALSESEINGAFLSKGGKRFSIESVLDSDPEASALDAAFVRMNERLAPIAATVKEINAEPPRVSTCSKIRAASEESGGKERDRGLSHFA